LLMITEKKVLFLPKKRENVVGVGRKIRSPFPHLNNAHKTENFRPPGGCSREKKKFGKMAASSKGSAIDFFKSINSFESRSTRMEYSNP